MKFILILLAMISLLGCSSNNVKPDEQITVKYKYIVNTIPEDMFSIPLPTYKINPAEATDKDTAIWMIESEKRYLEIEKRLRAIKNLQDEKFKSLKIDPKDLIKN